MRIQAAIPLLLCTCLLAACGSSGASTSEGGDTQLNAQLGMASTAGDADRVRALIHQGASPNIRDMMGLTPLIHASMNDNPEVVGALLEGGAETEARDVFNSTALMYSVGGDGTVTRTLIAGGADIEAADGNGNTALHHALMEENYAVARVLVEAGASVEVENGEGVTAILMAERAGQEELARLMRGR